MRERLIKELQMITGVVSEDIDYLMALALGPLAGKVEEKQEDTMEFIQNEFDIDLGDWFNQLGV